MQTLKFFFSLFVLAAIQAMSWGQSHEDRIRILDAYIAQARLDWEVPGLAVAIVKDGKTLLCKGYGVRSLESGAPVDTNTLFAICSTTKAMTAATMSMMVDAGKINWDDPVVEYLPEFQLHDPYITRSLRIRDLFTHNSGVGNADMLWYLWHHATDDILYRMRHLKPSYPIRGGYTYQNIMYAAAGKIIARLSDGTWEDFIKARLFQPLKMRNTYANQARSLTYENRSVPHYKFQDSIQKIPDGSADLIAPAGAVWSTIADMAKWMHFVLDSAKVGSSKLLSDENYREWLKPQAIVSDAGFYPTQKLTQPTWKTYALGWFQHDYLGKVVHFHTGSLQGTVAIIGLLPEEGLGVYVFGNLDHAELRHAIMYKVFDAFGESDPNRDWSKEVKALYKPTKKTLSETKTGVWEVQNLDRFVGVYEDIYLGRLAISIQSEQLYLTIGESERAILDATYPNTFQVSSLKYPWRSKNRIQFIDVGEGITALNYLGRKFTKVDGE